MNQQLSNEAITAEATATVTEDADIRSRVRNLTLSAIRQRHLEATEVAQIIKALVTGINLGIEQRTQDSKAAVGEAFAGLDEALQKSAEASHLALQELLDHGQQLNQGELAEALDNLKRTDAEFLAAIREVAEAAGSRANAEWQALLLHVQRSGTDTGRQVADTVSAFGQRVTTVAHDAKAVGSGAAQQLGSRFVQVASGILAGMTDALRQKK